MEDRRVVVTGMGGLCCLGNNVAALWASVLAGRCGIGPITRFDASAYRTRIAGEVHDFDFTPYMPPKEARRLDRYCRYAIAATEEALGHSGLDLKTVDPTRVGVLIGSGIGGIETFEDQVRVLLGEGPGRVSPFLIPMMIGDMASGQVSIRYGVRGPNFGVVSACATGSHAIGEAAWAVRRGDADVMITGGAEAPITQLGIAGFCQMKAMSQRNEDPQHASRPFDAQRDGFVIAEGAGILIIEELAHARRRGALIIGEILGYGATADAYHVTAPAPAGDGAARAIQIAMKHARLAPEDVDYVNAHGTSTQMNDEFETMALKTALGAAAYRVPVSSTKALHGHCLGAAGGIESIICLKVINEGRIPGTYNYEFPDPACDLNYIPNQTLEKPVRVALNLNFGFGGHNAVLAFRRYAGD